MDDLTQKWLSYFNHNDTYWTSLEKTVWLPFAVLISLLMILYLADPMLWIGGTPVLYGLSTEGSKTLL